MTAEKAIYIRLKSSLIPYKSKRYLDWLRQRYPGKELHHLFGSYTGSKRTDYMVIPLTREEHLKAEQNKSEFAIENLHKVINELLTYIQEIE